MTIDITRLMAIKSATDRYRGELRVLAADAGMDETVAKQLYSAAIDLRNASAWLRNASAWLRKAVLEASAEEEE